MIALSTGSAVAVLLQSLVAEGSDRVSSQHSPVFLHVQLAIAYL
jgi:hypothetical protein